MNILIFVPDSRHRSPDQQAQTELLISLGHNVILLSINAEGVLHANVRALGAQAFTSFHVKGQSVFFLINQTKYLIKFCKKHKVDIVLAHLQSCAVIAGMAKYFINAEVFYFRHNADYFSLKKNKKDIFINKLANRLSPHIIAISDNVKTELEKEGVNPEKIIRINLCYNFNGYLLSEIHGQAKSIKERSGNLFLILCIARLDVLKRHLLAFDVIKQLNERGYPCSMVCIGEGDKKNELQQWISENNMTDKIFLDGLVSNVADYILSSDVQLLLSYSEASNQAIKEVGFFKKTCIVCKKVGDFEDYIVHGYNGYLVDKENPVNEAVDIIKQLIDDRERLNQAGERLHEKVLSLFSMGAVKEKYIGLLKK